MILYSLFRPSEHERKEKNACLLFMHHLLIRGRPDEETMQRRCRTSCPQKKAKEKKKKRELEVLNGFRTLFFSPLPSCCPSAQETPPYSTHLCVCEKKNQQMQTSQAGSRSLPGHFHRSTRPVPPRVASPLVILAGILGLGMSFAHSFPFFVRPHKKQTKKLNLSARLQPRCVIRGDRCSSRSCCACSRPPAPKLRISNTRPIKTPSLGETMHIHPNEECKRKKKGIPFGGASSCLRGDGAPGFFFFFECLLSLIKLSGESKEPLCPYPRLVLGSINRKTQALDVKPSTEGGAFSGLKKSLGRKETEVEVK
eukprot:Hpha_TRINITY_DN16775_c0_g1::TRINITY_DN16775_c0_g1_i1::g.76632::m.76632